MEPTVVSSREHIVSSADTCGGKPRIAGTRIRVTDVVIWHERMGMSPEEIVSGWPHLTLGDVYAALSYYDDNRALVDEQMRRDEEFAQEFEARTSLTASKADEGDVEDDSLSSR
jgi:uncharacterized protein (DUF433 family)